MNSLTRILFLCCYFPLAGIAIAQVNYDKVIPDKSSGDSIDFEEKLVQIAWRNNPQGQVLQKEAQVASIEVEKAKTDWLNNIRLSGNLNEYSTQRLISGGGDDDEVANTFFPIYNFSVTIPVGLFFENPRNTQIAQSQSGIAQDNINAYKLELRAAVLTLYQEYLMQKRIFEIQSSITENNYAQFQLAQQQFTDEQITIEDFEAVQLEYNQQLINSIRVEKEYQTAKIALEELLGLPLEDI